MAFRIFQDLLILWIAHGGFWAGEDVYMNFRDINREKTADRWRLGGVFDSYNIDNYIELFDQVTLSPIKAETQTSCRLPDYLIYVDPLVPFPASSLSAWRRERLLGSKYGFSPKPTARRPNRSPNPS